MQHATACVCVYAAYLKLEIMHFSKQQVGHVLRQCLIPQLHIL